MIWFILGCGGNKRELVDQLDREVLALRERNDALWQEVRRCAPPNVPLPIYQELTQVFSGTDVTVSLSGLHVVLLVPETMMFDDDMGTQLAERSGLVTDMLGTALALYPDPHVWIAGEALGNNQWEGALWRWSSERAAVVASALVEDHGTAADRLTVAGVVTENQNKGWRLRVVIGPKGEAP